MDLTRRLGRVGVKKNRVFFFCTAQHRREPEVQLLELWLLYNSRKAMGEIMRVLLLTN